MPLIFDTPEDHGGAPEGAPASVRPRRRRLLAVVIAGAVLAVAVAVPAWIATSPAYFGRFAGLRADHSTWSTSTHAEVACHSCHVPPGPVPRGVYRLRMAAEFYLSLLPGHEPRVFASPTNAACLVCHSDLRTVSPEGDLRIPHRAHVSVLKMECVACHDYLVHAKSPEGGHKPPMAGCMRCHDGDRAKDACATCHTAKAAPKSHRAADWLTVHGAEASKRAECERCHRWAKDWCADCHSQRPASHTPDWRAVHGLRIAKHRGCEACHAGSFCVRCHGEVPALNLDPSVRLVR